MNKNRITIITVTYNCANEIESTIRSVLSQDYPDIEYIIIDGASKDGTLDVINQYKERISKVLSESDKGIYDAMNKALLLATGRWCNFMNAGDIYYDGHTVSDMFKHLEGIEKKKVLYGNTTCFYRDGSQSMHNTSSLERLRWTVNRFQPYTHQAVFYNIENKEDCKYDLRYRIAADYDVACRYWKKYGVSAYHYVPFIVCRYKAFDGVSSNPNNARRALKEKILIKIRNKMSIKEILKDIIRYILRRY